MAPVCLVADTPGPARSGPQSSGMLHGYTLNKGKVPDLKSVSRQRTEKVMNMFSFACPNSVLRPPIETQ